jgi:hypothetical protein
VQPSRLHLSSREQHSPDIEPAGALMLDFPASKTVKKLVPVPYKLPSLKYSVIAAQIEISCMFGYKLNINKKSVYIFLFFDGVRV